MLSSLFKKNALSKNRKGLLKFCIQYQNINIDSSHNQISLVMTELRFDSWQNINTATKYHSHVSKNIAVIISMRDNNMIRKCFHIR